MEKIQYKYKITEGNSKDYFILFLLHCGFRRPPTHPPRNAFLNFVPALLGLTLSQDLSLYFD